MQDNTRAPHEPQGLKPQLPFVHSEAMLNMPKLFSIESDSSLLAFCVLKLFPGFPISQFDPYPGRRAVRALPAGRACQMIYQLGLFWTSHSSGRVCLAALQM